MSDALRRRDGEVFESYAQLVDKLIEEGSLSASRALSALRWDPTSGRAFSVWVLGYFRVS